MHGSASSALAFVWPSRSAAYPRQGGSPPSLKQEDVIRAYRRYAPVYDSLFGRILQEGRVEMAKLVADEPCARLLEVGVGTGLALAHYPEDSLICGIDLSPHMLRLASDAVRPGRSVMLALMDAECTAFPNGAFDCVTAPYVLSVTPNPTRMLLEMQRVCRPGGRILVLNHFRGAGVWSSLERVVADHASWFGFRSTLSPEVFNLPGLRIESTTTVNLFGLSRLVVIRNDGG